MRIRAASKGDLAALARLNAEVQALHRAARPERYTDPSAAEIEDWFRRTLEEEPVAVLLAEDARGAAAGFAVVRRIDAPANIFAAPRRIAMIDQLGVTAAARRRGAGRALMQAAEAQARAWGATSIALEVQGFNEEARRFYQALDYETASWRMAKPL